MKTITAVLRIKNIDSINLLDFINQTNSEIVVKMTDGISNLFLVNGKKKFPLFMRYYGDANDWINLTMDDAFNFIDGRNKNTQTLDNIKSYFIYPKKIQQIN